MLTTQTVFLITWKFDNDGMWTIEFIYYRLHALLPKCYGKMMGS